MTRRKGEMSNYDINKNFPFQIAYIQPETGRVAHYNRVQSNCKDLSCCVRGHTFVRDGQWWIVKCFANEVDTEVFMALIDGERYDSKHPVTWGSWLKR